jgi:hypothetical protein
VREPWVGQEIGCIGGKDRSLSLIDAFAHATARNRLHAVVLGERAHAGLIGLVNGRGEHRSGCIGVERLAGGGRKPVEPGARKTEDKAGIGAELSGTHGQRCNEIPADLLGARG